jgi:hypothetical protein
MLQPTGLFKYQYTNIISKNMEINIHLHKRKIEMHIYLSCSFRTNRMYQRSSVASLAQISTCLQFDYPVFHQIKEKSEFHFLPCGFAFATLITLLSKNLCKLPILKALYPYFLVCVQWERY